MSHKNDILVSQSSGTYAYRVHIESLLSYGPEAKHLQLTAALFYKNTAGNVDHPNPSRGGEDERPSDYKREPSLRMKERPST